MPEAYGPDDIAKLIAQNERRREALRIIRDSFWTDGEDGLERVAVLQKIAADELAIDS